MQVIHVVPDGNEVGTEDGNPIVFAERRRIHESSSGDVAIFADVGNDGLQVLLLHRVQARP